MITPLTNMASATNDNGVISYYKYDSFYRLEKLLNDDCKPRLGVFILNHE